MLTHVTSIILHNLYEISMLCYVKLCIFEIYHERAEDTGTSSGSHIPKML